jgi:hypothetical protein
MDWMRTLISANYRSLGSATSGSSKCEDNFTYPNIALGFSQSQDVAIF